MEFKVNDFIEIEFDIYANGKLVQTTNEKKGKTENLKIEKYGNQTIVLGKNFILKALDEDILKNKNMNKLTTLELKTEDAYGKRNKKLIKVLPKSSFEEHKMRAVVGMVYDFNGTYGTVKSVIGGRVMVDFNSPLAGKNIEIKYKIISKIEDITKKITIVLIDVLKLPEQMFEIILKDKNITLKLPEEMIQMKDMIAKGIEEFAPEIKDYSVTIQNFKKQ